MTTAVVPDDVDPEVVRLVELAREGDNTAFAAIYDRYLDQVFGYVRRRVGSTTVAEDLVGDVFLRAWRRFDRFEWQGVDLGAWLMTIARNRVHDHFKSARFRLEQTTDEFAETPRAASSDDPQRLAEARDLVRALANALDQLKDDHREVIELRFVHDLSVAETAAMLGRSTGATKALQYRALRSLEGIVRDRPGFEAVLAAGLAGLVAMLRMVP